MWEKGKKWGKELTRVPIPISLSGERKREREKPKVEPARASKIQRKGLKKIITIKVWFMNRVSAVFVARKFP